MSKQARHRLAESIRRHLEDTFGAEPEFLGVSFRNGQSSDEYTLPAVIVSVAGGKEMFYRSEHTNNFPPVYEGMATVTVYTSIDEVAGDRETTETLHQERVRLINEHLSYESDLLAAIDSPKLEIDDLRPVKNISVYCLSIEDSATVGGGSENDRSFGDALMLAAQWSPADRYTPDP